MGGFVREVGTLYHCIAQLSTKIWRVVRDFEIIENLSATLYHRPSLNGRLKLPHRSHDQVHRAAQQLLIKERNSHD